MDRTASAAPVLGDCESALGSGPSLFLAGQITARHTDNKALGIVLGKREGRSKRLPVFILVWTVFAIASQRHFGQHRHWDGKQGGELLGTLRRELKSVFGG